MVIKNMMFLSQTAAEQFLPSVTKRLDCQLLFTTCLLYWHNTKATGIIAIQRENILVPWRHQMLILLS